MKRGDNQSHKSRNGNDSTGRIIDEILRRRFRVSESNIFILNKKKNHIDIRTVDYIKNPRNVCHP